VTLLLRAQFLQQRLPFLQIARVEPLGEPAVNGSQQFARLLHLAMVTMDGSVVLRATISVPELRPKSILAQFILALDVAKHWQSSCRLP
jgi:hypothetical protein